MHHQKKLAYLLPAELRGYVNDRAAGLHIDLQAARDYRLGGPGRSEATRYEAAKAQGAQAEHRMLELELLVNCMASRADREITTALEHFNTGFDKEDQAAVDYTTPERFNILLDMMPTGHWSDSAKPE